MKFKAISKIILYTLFICFMFSGIFNLALAQPSIGTGNTGNNSTGTGNSGAPVQPIPKLVNPLKLQYGGSIENLVFQLVDIAIFAGTIVAVFVLLFIGFKFVMAQGDPGAIKDAKSWLYYAVIGIAILVSSKAVVEIMKNTLISAGIVDSSLFNR
jgi:hypothetical protein